MDGLVFSEVNSELGAEFSLPEAPQMADLETRGFDTCSTRSNARTDFLLWRHWFCNVIMTSLQNQWRHNNVFLVNVTLNVIVTRFMIVFVAKRRGRAAWQQSQNQWRHNNKSVLVTWQLQILHSRLPVCWVLTETDSPQIGWFKTNLPHQCRTCVSIYGSWWTLAMKTSTHVLNAYTCPWLQLEHVLIVFVDVFDWWLNLSGANFGFDDQLWWRGQVIWWHSTVHAGSAWSDVTRFTIG